MGHLWRRVGPGVWVVIAAMAVTVVALVGVSGGCAQHPPGPDLVRAFGWFWRTRLHFTDCALNLGVMGA